MIYLGYYLKNTIKKEFMKKLHSLTLLAPPTCTIFSYEPSQVEKPFIQKSHRNAYYEQERIPVR